MESERCYHREWYKLLQRWKELFNVKVTFMLIKIISLFEKYLLLRHELVTYIISNLLLRTLALKIINNHKPKINLLKPIHYLELQPSSTIDKIIFFSYSNLKTNKILWDLKIFSFGNEKLLCALNWDIQTTKKYQHNFASNKNCSKNILNSKTTLFACLLWKQKWRNIYSYKRTKKTNF